MLPTPSESDEEENKEEPPKNERKTILIKPTIESKHQSMEPEEMSSIIPKNEKRKKRKTKV